MTEAAPLRLRDRRRHPTVAGVLGELLITAGVVVLLFVAWQLWIGDLIIGAQRNAEGASISEEWARGGATPGATPTAAPTTPAPTAAPPPPPTAPPVALPQPGDGETFGVLRVPRWGAEYQFPIAGGVSRDVTLDPIGLGHYPDTAMPGESGNFALAGHRTTYGKPLAELQSLRVGDAIVVETAGGWYTYRFRNIQYVEPTRVDVVLPVPEAPDVSADGSYITLTTCSPRFDDAERLIGYGVFESYTPRVEGGAPPASLALPAAGT